MVASLPLAFIPGLLSVASEWLATVPDGATLAPVEYYDMNTTQFEPGSGGDFSGIMALRFLTTALQLGVAGDWAMGAHSAGGPVIHQVLDFLADMQEPGGAEGILSAAEGILNAADFAALEVAVQGKQGQPARLPLAVFSFEGSLMNVDVNGWAQNYVDATEPPSERWIDEALSRPDTAWTWPMARHCCRSLIARCAEEPPRGLASIERWLQLPGSPGFVYVAGRQSQSTNRVIFPALREISNRVASGATLRTVKINGAGHNLNYDNPQAVADVIAEEMGLSSAVSGRDLRLRQHEQKRQGLLR